MALISRSQVLAAIVAQVSGMTFANAVNGATTWVGGANTRLQLWGAVDPSKQPYACVVKHREDEEYRGLGLLRRRFHYTIWCYSRSDTANGQTDLDTMLDAFDAAFGQAAADNPSINQLTFGGLVYWTRIEGRILLDPGDIDGQTLLIVPLVVELP